MVAKPLTHRWSIQGFTLVELMIVVALMGIAMGVAVPSIKSFLDNQRQSVAATELIGSVLFARSEAVKRNVNVFLVASSGSNFHSGWCVMLGAAGACDTLNPANSVMRVVPPNQAVNYTASSGTISFNTYGHLSAPVNIGIKGADDATISRCVTIDVTGGATVKRATTC